MSRLPPRPPPKRVTCASWPAPLPAWVRIERARPVARLNLSALDPPAKRALWQRLQRERPALAALLRDPNLQALRAAFDAELYIVDEL